MSQKSSLGYLVGLGALAALFPIGEAHAFKTGTHSAAATEVAEQLDAAISSSGSGTLHFEIDGRELEIAISEAEAYQAVIDWKDYFRAGVIGPDGFPDPLTGQIMMHGDESDIVKNLVEAATQVRPPDHDHFEPYEQRRGPAEFRSIDFVTAMLEFFNTRYTPSDAKERAQIVAFIMGYVSHGVGDSFAHTWVNELAGGAWSLQAGNGLWGPFSEEIKHIAVETMVDKLVPSELVSVPGDGGGQERIRLRAPLRFLDAFYSSLPIHSGLAAYNPSSGLQGFIEHYSNFNSYHGGFFYNYLNAQTQVAPSLKSWSGLSGFFDLAEDVNDNAFVNFGLDAAELPEEVMSWLAPAVNPLSWIDEVTGGFIDCHADPTLGLPTPIGDLREALDFVGGVNDRVDEHQEKSEIVRRNWVRLAQCTSENMARANAKDFDPDNPSKNRDSCADVVRAGWTDQGNPDGLYRGSIRPRSDVADIEYIDLNADEQFLLDQKAAFLGEDADDLFLLVDDPINNHAVWELDEAIEGKNGHRSLGTNLQRMLDYVVDFAFRVDELEEVLQPEDDRRLAEDYEAFCSAVRDPGFENCLDIAFAPVAAAGRGVVCAAEHAACTLDNVQTCLGEACQAACPFSNSQCADLCGTGEVSGCEATCDDWLCLEVCVPFVGCGDVCEPFTHTACTFACGLFSSEEDTCLEAAVDEAVCGVEAVVCNVDNFVDTITLDNYADELLTPARAACDTVDEALRLFKCLKGDPNLSEDQQKAERRTCVIDLCQKQTDFSTAECTDTYDDIEQGYEDAKRVKDAISEVTDALKDRPPHEIVNLAFLLEDLQQSPEYLQALKDTVQSTYTNWQNNPPPPTATAKEIDEYNRRGDVIKRWQKLGNDVSNLGTSSDPIGDFEAASEEAADLIQKSNELGLIPTIIGPTAQQIYADIGPSFTETFLPFFNTLQGMKLAPLTRKDLTDLFEDEASLQSRERLPWAHDKMSLACEGDGMNPYCDVFKSFDDPNCLDCDESSLTPNSDRFGWVPGRGMVAWNEYDASNPVRHITTELPFCNSDDSYENLYTRIFKVPASSPEFAGFDDPEEPWTSSQLPVSINTTNKTEGYGSLQVDKCGWTRLESPVFNTTEWGAVGDKLQVDVYIPAEQSNPWWVGDIMMYATVLGADLHYQQLPPSRGLTELPRGAWSTIEFSVPENVRTAMLGDFANASLSIELNYAGCTQPILLDNLRFAGELTKRQDYHLRGSQTYDVATNSLFSFDHVGDWSSNVSLSASDDRVQGTGSVAVNASWWTPVTSRPFSTTELSGVTRNLSIDVYVPDPQQSRWWNGTVDMYLTCGPIYNAYVGQGELKDRFLDEFNTIEYQLTQEMFQVLSGSRGRFDSCTITVAVNVSPGGTWLLDNLGFH